VGIPTVLLMTGDHLKFGGDSGAAPVFDLGGVQLLWPARTLREEGQPISGRALADRPGWSIVAVTHPVAPPAGFRAGPAGQARRDPAVPAPTLGGQRAH
jgi:methylenetetrahydrofolate reductase (NADPH)